MTIVIDASIALAWAFDDEASSSTDEALRVALSEGIAVPELWRLEVANVLGIARRRDRITEAGMHRFLALLDRIDVELVPTPTVSTLVRLAQEHGLTAYDAAYLHAAMTLGASLQTLDADLDRAARRAGVTISGG